MALHEALHNVGKNKFGRLINKIKNGECVFTAAGTTGSSTDDFGFPAPEFTEKTGDVLPCVWEVRSETDKDAREAVVGQRSEPVTRYRLTVPRWYLNQFIDIEEADQVTLTRDIDGDDDGITLMITGIVNEQNVHWTVFATVKPS